MSKFQSLLETYFSSLTENEIKVKFNPRKDYYLKSYDEMSSGTLNDDERVTYDRLSGMSGEVHTGEDFVKQLQKSGLGNRQINRLLELGILEPAEETSSEGDIEALDVMDDEDREFQSQQEVEDFIDPSFKRSPRFFESLQEAKKSYSAKEAHKGKDIGKKGKMFSKIAKSAEKKYGSKEAGKKVAGAILKKLRKG